jgi:hypothetical protein
MEHQKLWIRLRRINATVPVPYFLLFLCFRKDTQEISSELDEMKTETPIFPR